jgi:hypothetical protein
MTKSKQQRNHYALENGVKQYHTPPNHGGQGRKRDSLNHSIVPSKPIIHGPMSCYIFNDHYGIINQ